MLTAHGGPKITTKNKKINKIEIDILLDLGSKYNEIKFIPTFLRSLSPISMLNL